MRFIVRVARSLGGASALLVALSSTALAGNFAEVTFRSDAEAPPVAGVEEEIRFSLLQHGVTPVTSGDVTVSGTLESSGEQVTAVATSVGGGEWVATVEFPVSGAWLLGVSHSELQTSPPVAWSVGAAEAAATAPASAPAYVGVALLVGVVLAAIASVYAVQRSTRARQTRGAKPADGTASRSVA